MVRLLVTGVDGPVGLNVALRLADHCEVLGVYGLHTIESNAFRSAAWNGHDVEQLIPLADEWQPHWIIHCGPLVAAAWDSPPQSELADEQPRVAAELADLAVRCSARLTVLSSDTVFTGPRMFHDEASQARATCPQAVQALAMEHALAERDALVVRTHAYGWSPVEALAGFAERAFDAVSLCESADADGYRHATPILATDLADRLLRAFELRLAGLYHVAGAERTSPFRFVHQMASVFGLAVPRHWTSASVAPSDRCHRETSLSSKRARRMFETQMPLLGDGLQRFAEQRHNGWRARARVVGPPRSALETAA